MTAGLLAGAVSMAVAGCGTTATAAKSGPQKRMCKIFLTAPPFSIVPLMTRMISEAVV